MSRQYDLLTPRLRLHALSRDELALLVAEDRDAFFAGLGIAPSDAWPFGETATALSFFLSLMDASPIPDDRFLWIAIDPASDAIVADLGFHEPITGLSRVEMGYAAVSAFRGRGYIPEAVEALFQWGFVEGVTSIVVMIAETNASSLRVAAKLSMVEIPSDEEGFRCFERCAPTA
jgi:RimJ/RimL family protein N-acetyltransferase